jgi:starvation-inducible DNA-binding protein
VTDRFSHGFGADELQRELRDLLCPAVVGDHVRWVVKGDAAELADWLAEAAAQWRAWADDVAKQLVRLGVAPDGRVRSLAEDVPLNWVPEGWLGADDARRLVADRLAKAAEWARYCRSQSTDAEIVQLLDTVRTGLESQAGTRREIAVAASARERLHKNAAVRAEALRTRLR